MLPLPFLFLASYTLVNAGSANKGDACDRKDNRLQTGTFQFFSDCNSVTFCAENNTCVLKGCRRDEFPFGYEKGSHLPDKCPTGQFCPDEADECQDLLPVDSACQLNRDGKPGPHFSLFPAHASGIDECAPPPNADQLRDTTNRGLNVNGAVCLNNVCMYVRPQPPRCSV